MLLLQSNNLDTHYYSDEEAARQGIKTMLPAGAKNEDGTLEELLESLQETSEHQWKLTPVPLADKYWVLTYHEVEENFDGTEIFHTEEDLLEEVARLYEENTAEELNTTDIETALQKLNDSDPSTLYGWNVHHLFQLLIKEPDNSTDKK